MKHLGARYSRGLFGWVTNINCGGTLISNMSIFLFLSSINVSILQIVQLVCKVFVFA